ncbi:hypothetical protein QQ008_18015 [Fulvivirgaceae bacterium BMA10]|uniref:Uncharacterized protein n=1 Tax=Splendidivirga corallicola TaxID=3051826 RepID=A0ABT8KRA7_9BACT|nr:hypothetical protein [Fulvivirgaceae bacterium BMA10]
MYINKVISYKGAWREFFNNHSEELEDIIDGLSNIFKWWEKSKIPLTNMNVHLMWRQVLEKRGWEGLYLDHGGVYGEMGPTKNGISVYMSLESKEGGLHKWLFFESLLAIKNEGIKIPILLTQSLNQSINNGGLSSFQIYQKELETLNMLNFPYPFIIAGFDDEYLNSDLSQIDLNSMFSIENPIVVDKCIEFPPEYHQAGLNILNFFGTYLRENYPNEEARVKIEQDGLIVRLIVEKEDGNFEVVEKALHEYELIITEKEPPERFTDNEKLILELRYELRNAYNRIESQKEIMLVQSGRYDKLLNIVGQGLSAKNKIDIDVNQTTSNSNTIAINQNVSSAIGSINEIKDMLPKNSEAQKELKELEESLEKIDEEKDPKKVKKSPAMSKFKRFIEKVSEGNEAVGKAIKAAEGGWEIFKDLSGKYNKIAEWCGLPQVPSVFTK